jgi:hypothetical protein
MVNRNRSRRENLGSRGRRATLRSGNVAVAIYHHINGINSGLIHGGEICIFHQDDLAISRVQVEILLDGFFGFADIDRQHD